jgi:hypothetical protein
MLSKLTYDIYLISFNHKSRSHRISLSFHVSFNSKNQGTHFGNFSPALTSRLSELATPGVLHTPPGDTHQIVDDDVSFKRRLNNFTKAVVCKRDSPLIREPPKQPPAKPVLPW